MPGMVEVKRWSGGWNEAQEQAEVKGDDKKHWVGYRCGGDQGQGMSLGWDGKRK